MALLLGQRSALTKVRLGLGALTTSEGVVADWILSNPGDLPSMSMGQVAAACGVSDTTVLRMCRSLGFRGFIDLKFRLVEDGARDLVPRRDDATDGLGVSGVAATLFEDCIRGLRDTLDVMGDSLQHAVDLLGSASETLIVGVGTAHPVVETARSQLFRLGLNCRAQTDSYLQRMEVALMQPPSLVIAVSYSGASIDPVETLRMARERGLSTMCVTGMPGSPLTTHADVSLASVATESHTEPVAGRVVQVAVVSALARAYAERHSTATAAAEAAAFDSVIDKTL